MSKRFREKFERRERDFYATPLGSVLPLIPHLQAARVREFCEPCCGEGDLVRIVDSFGLHCVYAGDIVTGHDALDIERFDAGVITNTPYHRPVLLALLEHFLAAAPFSWLLPAGRFRPCRLCASLAPPLHRHRLGRSGKVVRRLRHRECRLVPIRRRPYQRPSVPQWRGAARPHGSLYRLRSGVPSCEDRRAVLLGGLQAARLSSAPSRNRAVTRLRWADLPMAIRTASWQSGIGGASPEAPTRTARPHEVSPCGHRPAVIRSCPTDHGPPGTSARDVLIDVSCAHSDRLWHADRLKQIETVAIASAQHNAHAQADADGSVVGTLQLLELQTRMARIDEELGQCCSIAVCWSGVSFLKARLNRSLRTMTSVIRRAGPPADHRCW